MIPAQKHMRPQAGFTLVELAIVMIIIGLLIAGILKGQQLITNAKVTSQVAQVKGIDAATSTFKDMYAGLPGDILTPNTRLPNCAAAPCNVAGNGDGVVGNAAAGGNFAGAPTAEMNAFFVQLATADLLTGINPIANTQTWGGDFPAAKLDGGIHAGSLAGGAVPNNGLGIAATSVMGGIYVALHNAPAGAVPATGMMTANEAQRIDTKMDDGIPTSGSVFPGGAATCIAGGVYNESVQGNNCNLYIRIQG
jgi:prepilin-type N-terminal cleavage/methylation domain-containing protein